MLDSSLSNKETIQPNSEGSGYITGCPAFSGN